jgi:Ca2+-binding EF-hand superfamily protein
MALPLLILPMLAAAAPAPIIVTGQRWAPFISPMGEPFRSRSPDDDTVSDWFNQADRNHDGYLTEDEMEADAERFFNTLDTNHDGQIDPDELARYEWQVAPEIQVNSRQRNRRGDTAGPITADDDDQSGLPDSNDQHHKRKRPDPGMGIGMDGSPMGAARYSLLNIPEPVAAADTDFNRVITLDEFRQAARERFQLLDTKHAGKVGLAELEAMLPPPPAIGHKPKPPKNRVDTRYGLPVPPAASEPCHESSC